MLIKLLVIFFIMLIFYQICFTPKIIEGYTDDDINAIKVQLGQLMPLYQNPNGTLVNLVQRVTDLENKGQAVVSSEITNRQSAATGIKPKPI